MTDVLIIIAIACSCTGAVGVLGLLAVPALRRRSVRQAFAAVAVVAVLAFVAGLLGAAQAMFLSRHDFRVTLIVTAVAGLVSLAFAVRLAHQVASGSRDLRAAARGLGTEGHYTAPARPPTTELDALSRELAEASRKLAQARDRERALEASRRDLVAWVSHDLRSPLAALRAMAEALEDDLADDPARYHKLIRVEVDRLARMVDDLFELARIHAGTLHLSVAPISLADLVSDTLASADALARAQGVRLTGRAEPIPGGVTADARELSRVLTNLVANAIQHTPHEGTVRVEAGARDGHAVLAVTDSCGGIPDADLDRVFCVAWRGTHARTPLTENGGGLGLAIVHGIVDAHHGSVSVRNVDGGCRFEVQIPLDAERARPQPS